MIYFSFGQVSQNQPSFLSKNRYLFGRASNHQAGGGLYAGKPQIYFAILKKLSSEATEPNNPIIFPSVSVTTIFE